MGTAQAELYDANDLMNEIFEATRKTTEELGKTDEFMEEEKTGITAGQ